jgi:hypothetical protein
MTTFKDNLRNTTALSAEDRRAAALRILLALVDADPTVSGASLILPDGSVTYLDAAQLRRDGQA